MKIKQRALNVTNGAISRDERLSVVLNIETRNSPLIIELVSPLTHICISQASQKLLLY